MCSHRARIGKTKILKNPVPESEPTPLGFRREALTNKKHSRTRSVRLMFRVLRVLLVITSFGKTLTGNPKQALAKSYDQLFELPVT